MNRSFVVVAALSLAYPFAGMAQSTPQTQSTTQQASQPAQIPGHELHSLIVNAHSSTQYQELADYFHQQETKYRAEAADAKIEHDRRAQINASLMHKYPRPVDSAQYVYELYVSKANSAALQAQHFNQLAAAQTQQEQQLATASQGNL